MEILSHGKDIYDRINYCNMCGCVFKTTRADANVFYENDICKCFVECPSCYSLILMGISSQRFARKDIKNYEENGK